MTTTPLWVPLVVAGLGVLGTVVGTIAGVLITQKRSDRREQANWNRERERERERWEREDAQRTFEQRRMVYVEFYESLQDMARQAYEFDIGVSEAEEIPFEFDPPLFYRLQNLRVYATLAVTKAAENGYLACVRWHSDVGGDGEADDEGMAKYHESEQVLYREMRRDLGTIDEAEGESSPALLSGYAYG